MMKGWPSKCFIIRISWRTSASMSNIFDVRSLALDGKVGDLESYGNWRGVGSLDETTVNDHRCPNAKHIVGAKLAVDVARIIELDVELVDVGEERGVVDRLGSRHWF